jgi:hypothetical protein
MTIDTYNRKARFAELKPYDQFSDEDDFMEVCEWHNGEGECLQVLVNYKDG